MIRRSFRDSYFTFHYPVRYEEEILNMNFIGLLLLAQKYPRMSFEDINVKLGSNVIINYNNGFYIETIIKDEKEVIQH